MSGRTWTTSPWSGASAANTLSSYRRDLRRYLGFLDARGVEALDGVTEQVVTDFLQALREGDNVHPAFSSVLRRQVLVAAVRGLHRFAVADGLARSDPSAGVKPPSPAKRLPKALPLADVEKILPVGRSARNDSRAARPGTAGDAVRHRCPHLGGGRARHRRPRRAGPHPARPHRV